ncbi:MAG: ornithine carbamoyltransferase [Acidimicrobiia bacterium]
MDFLSASDLGADGLAAVLESAGRIKRNPASVAGVLAGRRVGLFFMKPSTRTRVSCEVACHRLGAHPLVLRNEEVGLGTRESVADVARVLDRYLDLLALRVFDHAHLEEVAQHAGAPVVNLLSDREHPCQAVADLQTLAEHRPLPGASLAYVGDGNNVCHSLLLAATMAGVEVRVACPEGYQPDGSVVAAASQQGKVLVTRDPEEAVTGADAVYTDVWASMGRQDEAAERRSRFEAYRVDEKLFGQAAPDAIFLHCLPAHRGEEVTAEVLEHSRSRVFDQAENRLHAFAALLVHLLG